MKRCFQLALLGGGNVAPNPMVGAVLVYKDRIIGEGYHEKYGENHAEVNCIESIPDADRKFISHSTLYVSLEPCSHFGKTPPCVDLILKHSIKRVVIACSDPFEKVNGSGIQKLLSEGVEVLQGILKKEAIALNKRFFTFHQKQRPYIILKWAQSSDQKIGGSGKNRIKISGIETNHLVHKWRSEEGVIMAGTNTILQDDPMLNNRLWQGKSPLRVVIDKQLRIPASAKIFSDNEPLILLNSLKNEIRGNKVLYKIEEEYDMLPAAFDLLYTKNILSVFIEGGAKLLQSCIDAGWWDEARVITNNSLLIGEGTDAPLLNNECVTGKQQFKNDEISIYLNDK